MVEESVNSGKLVVMTSPPAFPLTATSPPAFSLTATPSATAALVAAHTHMHYNPYPPPLAKWETVVANRTLFIDTLQKLHVAMGTKFMIPIIGGRDLDLHKLFVEVTSRGGIEKILREKKWKEVTATFNFPSTATNASFILRKHYFSLLHHYEQIYFLKAQGWSPMPPGASWQSGYSVPIAVHGAVAPVPALSSPPIIQPQVIRPEVPVVQAVGTPPTSPVNSPVTGVIDGKFEDGYLVTVTVGKQKLRGVLYHTAPTNAMSPIHQVSQAQTTGIHLSQSNAISTSETPPVIRRRRRRRKKCEIRRRDPAHPKTNRSGYNFFFAEQHAKLKPEYVGRDREISRIIGERWNHLQEDEKTIYQEKAVHDKERYMKEMESYRERQRLGLVISNAVPIQQRLPNLDSKVENVEVADKDYSEAFEDEYDEEDDESSLSASEYEDEPEDPHEVTNLETTQRVTEPVIQSSHVADQSSVENPPVAPLTLSMNASSEVAVEEAGKSREQEQNASNAVSEDQQVKTEDRG